MIDLPKVLVIIVTWNKQSYVVDLLNSLAKLHYDKEKIDIVVVDNASSDETVPIVKREFPYVHLIENSENLGGTGGFNTGLSYAFNQPENKYDYLWLLDNDVVVHPHALSELINLLEDEPDVAIAGSTMMQLTCPWVINEMGAYVELGRGGLIFNRHLEVVKTLEGKSVKQLQGEKIDLSEHLEYCRPSMDVDYVAAASLVIRAPLAKKAGLWEDFFIHYDDVEWCLRIARMGHRIVVSACSLIWHVPAEYKVPSWVLYYDNRNVLYMLEKHAGKEVIRGAINWILKKSFYYSLLGKADLARLHLQAVDDYRNGKTGKKDIALDDCYFPLDTVEKVLMNKEIKRVLIPWTVNLQATNLQIAVVRAKKKRPMLQVDYLVPPPSVKKGLLRQFPEGFAIYMPQGKIKRLLRYIKLKNRYDLVFQSDYQPILPLNLLAKKILFVNLEGISLRSRKDIKKLLKNLKTIWTQRR